MKKKRAMRQIGEYLIFVLPVFVFLILIELVPFIQGLVYSLTDWNGISTDYNFVGLRNYTESLAPDSTFWNYFGFSLRMMLVNLPICNILAILLANIFNSPRLGTGRFARVVMFSPSVISMTVIAFLWQYMFSTCSDALGDLLGIGFLHVSWLGDPNMAFWSIVIVSVWGGIGFQMLIYTAGLQSIDDNILEASVIDGVSPLQQLIHIKLPMMMSSVTVCVFLSLSGNLKMFDLPYLLTKGGPAQATTTPAIDIFVEAFNRHSYGVATARSMILFVFVLIITTLQVTLTKRQEVQQ